MNEPLKILTLKRLGEVKDCGTTGVLYDEDVPFCLTVERPWLNNQSGISCIPTGEHMMAPVESPKFGATWEVKVDGRDHILFHRGNIDDDSHGCIVVGENFTPIMGQKVGLGSSGAAFSEFFERMRGLKQAKLIIQNVKAV